MIIVYVWYGTKICSVLKQDASKVSYCVSLLNFKILYNIDKFHPSLTKRYETVPLYIYNYTYGSYESLNSSCVKNYIFLNTVHLILFAVTK